VEEGIRHHRGDAELRVEAASYAAPTTSFTPTPTAGRLKASPLSIKMLPRRVLLRVASELVMVHLELSIS
jgi:hypothetical protein